MPEFIDAAGARIAVSRAGVGEAVLCLHAVGHSGRDFVKLAERLGQKFEFTALDWPGQGASSREVSPASAARYAEILASAVDALGLKRFFILGNSIGGAAAILHAAAYPAQVRAIVLCNPGGLQRAGLLASLVCNHMARFFARGERGEKDFEAQFRRYYEHDVLTGPASAWRREEIIADCRKSAPILREAWKSFGGKSADIRHLMLKLSCPVFFAWAKGDKYVAWSRSKRAALSTPAHSVKLFRGSHAAFLEQPEEFDAAFLEFVGAVDRGADTTR